MVLAGIVQVLKQVVWMKLDFDEVKINIDGSKFGDPPCAKFGGLIRDDKGV